MISCRDALEFLADYLAGELPPAVREAFDEHLAECLDCRRYLSTYRHTIALGKGATTQADAEAADDLPEALVVAILAARGHIQRN